jgi:hypothetical protein
MHEHELHAQLSIITLLEPALVPCVHRA